MLSPKIVIPECYIDSCFIDVLLNFKNEGSNHAKGNATVLRKMTDKFAKGVCVGIIDKDKIELKNLKENFELINIRESREYFDLFKHKELMHFVIRINPAIEAWILRITKELKIELKEFGWDVTSPKELGKFTKDVKSKSDPEFQKLFKSIVNKSEEKKFLPLLKMKAIILMILEKGNSIKIKDFENV